MKMTWWRAGVAISLFGALVATGCTGGKESNAAEEQLPKKNPIVASQPQQPQAAQPAAVDAKQEIKSVSKAIPIYAGAQFRNDLTRRDEVMIRSQYGPQARVLTLATNDSYPQVYHYYTTYLAQFRAYPPQAPYPPEAQSWRTMDVNLNEAMQDPFIPGDTIAPNGTQVRLQVAETEAEPKTVIRYIIVPGSPTQQVANNEPKAPATPVVKTTHGGPEAAAASR